MKNKEKNLLFSGAILTGMFVLWTALVITVDVQNIGVNGTAIGFAEINSIFHSLTGVNMTLYTVTDWAGLVPVSVCVLFGSIGLYQLISRKSLLKVDEDIIISGVYYIAVIFFYLIFEMYPVNYRPVLINGVAEASYPSSTTLLVLCVMPSFALLCGRRLKNTAARKAVIFAAAVFSVLTVAGRLASGVHWLTDIIGSLLLSGGLFCIYMGVAEKYKEQRFIYGVQ